MAGNFVDRITVTTQRKKIFVIDDVQVELDQHCKALWLLDYDTIPFLVTGNMTLGAVRRVVDAQQPDGMLTDWQLGPFKGTDVGRMLRDEIECGDLPAIPVILHSSGDDIVRENSEAHKSEYGFQGVFKKGFYSPIDAVFSAYFDAHPEVTYDRPARDR